MTRPFLFAAALAALSVPAQAQICPVADPIWIEGHVSATAALNGQVTALGTAVSAARALTAEMVLSAIKVNVSQIATNGERETNVASGTHQAVAGTLAGVFQGEAMVEAKEQYGIETGQGVNACGSVSLLQDTNEALANITFNGRGLYRNLDVSPGKVTPLPEATRDRLDHADRMNAAVLLDPAANDQDRASVIEAMAGLPMPKPTSQMPGSEADLMMLRARRVEALRSPALVSLSAVRAAALGAGHGFGMAAQSPLKQLDALIAQYGGGPAFETWSAGLAGQSEHGLLIELGRLRSITLTLRQALVEQQARTTAVLGTMLAAQAGGGL
ncbi:hypothetical protein [Methylobacterium sp. 22177]|uniref:hypothetical protein n=1 Tax=Methylobacterium sp. 22177 TaxID=3453885 RepID=UPI003F86FC66